MLYKPDRKVLQAFAQLEGDPRFMTILEYFQTCLDRLDHEGRKRVEEHRLRWDQGAGQVLEGIMQLRRDSQHIGK